MTSHTSVTLLARLRQVPADQAAWVQFTERYGRKIYAWCRQWNLQEADAEDVTQAVLIKLAEKCGRSNTIPTQEFSGLAEDRRPARLERFLVEPQSGRRGRRQPGARNVCRPSRRATISSGGWKMNLIASYSTKRWPGCGCDVTPRTMEAFERTALKGQSGAEVGHALGMKVATVFVAKSKVQKMLQEELRKLDDGDIRRDSSALAQLQQTVSTRALNYCGSPLRMKADQ